MSLLRKLSTTRNPSGEPPVVRYEARDRIAYVLECGKWVPSFESARLSETKKCDIETGEDQKGQ